MNRSSTSLVDEARRCLDVERLAFSIHDASFPADGFDLGRGSPYSMAALLLAEFLSELGFDVLQVGPQGEISPRNPSPYDAAAFSRSTLSIDPAALLEKDAGASLEREELLQELEARPPASSVRADHEFAWAAQRRLLMRAFRRCREGATSERVALEARIDAFARRHRDWIDRDGVYDALSALHGGSGFRDWPEIDRRLPSPRPDERERFGRRWQEIETRFAEEIAFHRFCQYLAHSQHEVFRRRIAPLGMQIYGDLQIGLADRDVWAFEPVFLDGYRLGAPPSRTNPAGQPWGYPVFDPDEYRDGGTSGTVLRFLRRRLDLVFDAYDGLRIDHPHGLVCPWVYRVDRGDPQAAVPQGARLFSASGVPGHSAIARHDIARPDQIDRDQDPWADRWVRDLDPEQVDRYEILFDEVVAASKRSGAGAEAILCEVLSTLPFPLERVMDRFGLGRFRVTSKLDPSDPEDPYRIEAAQPPDWLMIGTHDTPSIWALLSTWDEPKRRARAEHAAERLELDPSRRARFAETLVREPGLLAQAMLAEIFTCPARNVMIFFSDLLGIGEAYNQPGTVSSENWSLRVPPDFRSLYRERIGRHRALDIRLALALALQAKPEAPRDLAHALFEEVRREAPVPDALVAERA
ncbi:MAG: 4-alpha-glucanotransferase [bacterium]